MMIRPRLVATILFFSVSAISAQSFRGEVVARLPVLQDTPTTVSLGGGQVLILEHAADPHWLESIEISVTQVGSDPIPAGAYSIMVFSNVDTSGEPSEGFITLGGSQLSNTPVVSAAGLTVSIPVENRTTGHSPQRGIDITFSDLAVQVVPVMKGMPPSIGHRQFEVTLTPGYSRRGGLAITLTGTDTVVAQARGLLEVTLDRAAVTADNLIVLDPGIYRLGVQAGNLLDQSRNVAIESARITRISLEAREPVAYIRFSLPSVAEVFIDGVRIDIRQPLQRAPGSHLMLIRLGDFTISRQMTLEAHEEYEVGLDMDVLIRRN